VIERGADLAGKPLYPPPYAELATLTLDGRRFHLAHFRADLLARLRDQPGAQLTDFPRYLDAYLADPARRSAAQLAADLAFFDAFYFSVHPDPARRAALLTRR
jgi:hypothetical protein